MLERQEVNNYPDEMPEEIRRALQADLDASAKFLLLDSRLAELCRERSWYDEHSNIMTSRQIKGLIMRFIVESFEHISETALNKVPLELRQLALEYYDTYKKAKRNDGE